MRPEVARQFIRGRRWRHHSLLALLDDMGVIDQCLHCLQVDLPPSLILTWLKKEKSWYITASLDGKIRFKYQKPDFFKFSSSFSVF